MSAKHLISFTIKLEDKNSAVSEIHSLCRILQPFYDIVRCSFARAILHKAIRYEIFLNFITSIFRISPLYYLQRLKSHRNFALILIHYNIDTIFKYINFFFQWIGLVFPKHSIYVDSLRECYEAYVIYNFMVYLLNYLNSSMDLEANLELKPQVHHIFPFCCLGPWEMGR